MAVIIIGATGGGQVIQGGGCSGGSGGVGVASDVSDGRCQVGSDVSDVGAVDVVSGWRWTWRC